MKKSRSIRLVLLGSASIALGACGEALPEDARFYPTVQECVADFGAAACEEAKVAADQALASEAPRFAQKQECEAEFGVGNCETRQTAGGSFFMPLFMGYMIGNMMGGNRYAQPVYRGQGNSAVVSNSGRLFNVGNFDNAAGRSAFRPATRVAEVRRGGFGTTAPGYGTAGG